MDQHIRTLNRKFYRAQAKRGTSVWSHGQKRATVIVMIHGLFMCGEYFSQSAQAFFDQGYNVVNVTLPGHEMGVAGDPETKYEAWLEYTETLIRAARKLGTNVVVVGHSLGGALAVYLSQKNLVDGLILLQPALKVTRFSQGLSFLGWPLRFLRPADRRVQFVTGNAATAFAFWKYQPELYQAKISVPTLLFSSRIDPVVCEIGHLEFSNMNSESVELVRHYQDHMWNVLTDAKESYRINAFLQKNFPLKIRRFK